MAKVIKKPNGCWIYGGTPGASGYGNVKVNGKQYRAARLSWELQKGEIPAGLFVCHHCDTPLCVNPDHLYLGTVVENTRDRMARKRHNCGRGEKCNFSKLNEQQARYIKSSRGKKTAYELLMEFPKLKLTPAAIWAIWAGRTWKHLK